MRTMVKIFATALLLGGAVSLQANPAFAQGGESATGEGAKAAPKKAAPPAHTAAKVKAKASAPAAAPSPSFDIIPCGDAAGKIHKCIRIDPAAGEINDAAKGASYRVIYGE